MKSTYLFFLTFLFLIPSVFSQKNSYQKEKFVQGNDTLKYRILYPKDFSETNKYPLLLFLHGSGERGSDNEKQLVHGSKLFLDSIQKHPTIVIFPQCPENDSWINIISDRTTKPITRKFPLNNKPTKALQLVMDLLDDFQNKPFVAKEKIYVGGLSMGGMGTFEVLSRKPTFFAGAFSICGGGNTALAEKYAKNTPMWIFHGAKDDVVNPQLSLDMVSSILNFGGTPNFTLYHDANHNSWDQAFSEKELLNWLFSNSLNKK
jgi:predicted peptidase